MNTTVNIDKAGRVIIPKAVRDELGLEAGDTLNLGVRRGASQFAASSDEYALRKRAGRMGIPTRRKAFGCRSGPNDRRSAGGPDGRTRGKR